MFHGYGGKIYNELIIFILFLKYHKKKKKENLFLKQSKLINWLLMVKMCALTKINSAVIWLPPKSGRSHIHKAKSQGGPLFVWALNLQALQAFLFPRQGREAADSTFSSLYPSSSILPSPSVLFTLCSPAAVPPRRHSRPPRSWRPPQIGQWRPSLWEHRVEVQEWVGEWRWHWLTSGDFFLLRYQAGGWRYD